MTGNPCWQAIPTKLSLEQFEEFVLPHLSGGRRGPPPTLSSHKIFNYILQLLYMGCQWALFVHGRPRFAKLSFHDGLKVKIAPVHSDFIGGTLPRSLMECAGWCLNRKDALLVPRTKRALPTTV